MRNLSRSWIFRLRVSEGRDETLRHTCANPPSILEVPSPDTGEVRRFVLDPWGVDVPGYQTYVQESWDLA